MARNLTSKHTFHKYIHNGEYTVASLKDHTYVTESGLMVDTPAWDPNATREYLIGPIVERLAQFEAIGMEPAELMKAAKLYKLIKENV